ncbi:isochorismatase [marine bacterium AO1-C]|nr:isochorismatase [marine bacterium AO1-C]
MEQINLSTDALVLTDPQNDFLSADGVAWGVVGESVQENNTVVHIAQLLQTAKEIGLKVFVSPHYYYPKDHEWKFEGTLEKVMHDINMFDRKAPLSLEGFAGSGADWLDEYKPFIEDGETIICSPHKVYGPECNDLVLQLRKHGIQRVILAGMSANLCVEAHMRELIEQGFKVTVVNDATAGGRTPELGDGYQAALINFRFIANESVSTAEAIDTFKNNL